MDAKSQIAKLVSDHQATGLSYDDSFGKVRREYPQLFEGMHLSLSEQIETCCNEKMRALHCSRDVAYKQVQDERPDLFGLSSKPSIVGAREEYFANIILIK